MDFPHASNTQYGADNYSRDVDHPEFPGGWLSHSVKAHPCYDPKKVVWLLVVDQRPRLPLLGIPVYPTA